jgi:addiction module RelE/StbE family toxin
MKVTSHRTFLKAYSRLTAIQKKNVDSGLRLFKADRADPTLRDHALKGRMKSLRAFSAAHDLRIIYREEGGFVTVLLIDVGTHNQVY